MINLLINPTKFLRRNFYSFYLKIFSGNENKEIKAKKWSNNTEIVIVALLLALFIRAYVIATFYIPSASMMDTLIEGDRLVGTRFDFVFREPYKGEIIIFRDPMMEGRRLIKRLIGKEGDVILIKDSKLYVNGELKVEPYMKEPIVGDFGPVTVPKDHYFVMGDNRNHSSDSRFWKLSNREIQRYYFSDYKFWRDNDKVGFLSKENVESRPLFRIWPINRIGVVQ